MGVAPKIVFIKNRTAAQQWISYNTILGSLYFGVLNSTIALATSTTNVPTSTTFSVSGNADVNGSGNSMVAYCWSEIAGFSKFGSYTGNSNSDGTFVYTGFRPKFLLVKNVNTIASWIIHDSTRDTYNVTQVTLYPNLTNNDANDDAMDFLSNGFKWRLATGDNASGTYIYMAFAENPFKHSNAR